MAKLKSIKINTNMVPLYDIEVEDNHNFVVNGGVVVKNSEQYLSRESLCVLSSINCEKFSIDPEIYNIELCKIAESVNRFLDNVNTCELEYLTYATPHQKLAIESLRRTGAGYTNMAGWLFKDSLIYGTQKANKAIEEFTKTYNYHLYDSSIRLGKEKGSFGLFNRGKLEKSPFIQRMMKLGLKFEALRNVTLSSIAPSGTLSLMFRDNVMSYGIEPAFGMYYWKRTRMSGKYAYYFCVPHIVREVYQKAGYEIPIKSDTIEDTWDGSLGKPIAEFIEQHKKDVGIEFHNATEISPFDKLDCMARVMKWIDSSISVTYMLPEDTNWKDVYKFIMEAYEKGVKSIAAFPDRKMYGIIAYEPFKELAMKLKDEGVNLHVQNFDDEELEALNMSKEEIQLHVNNAPKRLGTLEADIYSITVGGDKFVIVIGLQNGVPYEIFGGDMNGFNIKRKTLKGSITRLSKGKYALEIGDLIIDDFSEKFTPVEKLLFRSASLMLRHGIPIEHIVEQFQKATEDMTSLTSAICRVLKKYISDGQKVTGRQCPSCSGELVYHAGCTKCTMCPFSGCD